MLDLSIIIVNWNVKDLLKNCLASIQKSVFGLSYEIIIVDNNSSDGSVEVIEKEYPNVILIKSRHNLGYGRANNQGIKKAKGKYVLILNPDTIVLSNTIKKMNRFLDKNPKVGACGPAVLDDNYELSHPVIHDPTIWELFGNDTFLRKLFPNLCSPIYPNPKKRTEVERLSGCCFLSRKEVLEMVGLFDEKIFLFYDDTDLFFRLRRRGWKVYYLPELAIVHLHGKSVSYISPVQKELLIRKSSLIYFRNRYGPILSIFLKLFLILSYLLYVIVLKTSFLLFREEAYHKKEIFYSSLFKLTRSSLFGHNS